MMSIIFTSSLLHQVYLLNFDTYTYEKKTGYHKTIKLFDYFYYQLLNKRYL